MTQQSINIQTVSFYKSIVLFCKEKSLPNITTNIKYEKVEGM